MKKLVLFLIVFTLVLVVQTDAFARTKVASGSVEELQILCMTEFPTTSFIGFPEGNVVKMRMSNANGVAYMPIASHIVTSADIPYLQKRAELAKEFGSSLDFDIEMSKCEIYSDGTLSCGGGAKMKGAAGGEIQFVSLGTSKTTTKLMDYVFEEVKVSAYFKVNGQDFDVTMKYSNTECGFSTKEKSLLKK
ncbi:MAG: hypothetical protein ACLGGX_12520 [Bdellovibrionia bacterium]